MQCPLHRFYSVQCSAVAVQCSVIVYVHALSLFLDPYPDAPSRLLSLLFSLPRASTKYAIGDLVPNWGVIGSGFGRAYVVAVAFFGYLIALFWARRQAARPRRAVGFGRSALEQPVYQSCITKRV